MAAKTSTRVGAIVAGVAASGAALLVTLPPGATAADKSTGDGGRGGRPDARVEILAPRHDDTAGTAGRAWVVDLRVAIRGSDPLTAAGFTAPQLTGPGGHANAAPFPGAFAAGRDEALPGLVVLSSTTTGFSGPGTNLANLFNLTALTDQRPGSVAIQDTWIVGAPLFGLGTRSTLTVAVVDDLDGNGVFDDAPDVVTDADGDGDVDRADVRALGVASHVRTVTFTVAP